MKRPNFFILGAPKAGTTTLANWLSEHRQILMSPLKEPHFFNFDFGPRLTRSFKAYESLFEAATSAHVAVGEATTRYLYSRTTVPAILHYAEEPRFIVMIRNPVELAYSLHDQTLFNGDETELDFERAWELQQVRMYGDQVPRFCADPQLLMYGPLCRLGEQLERLLAQVPREKVLLINLEHLCEAPLREYRQVLDFLGVEYDGRTSFPLANPAKERRFPRLWRTVQAGNQALRILGVPPVRIGITRLLFHWDKRPRMRAPLDNALRTRLKAYFAEDVARVERISGWDLRHWKE